METPFVSNAEKRAAEAQWLPSLSKINLLGVREGVKGFLAEFGRHGVFAEYTRHDMSHVDTMLNMLDWLVVPESQAAMTPADWMMSVLAIYLHDAGLVVTRNEFEQRHLSSFPAFKAEILGLGPSTPYSERVLSMEDSERERFLYQEFVRLHHAERIRTWIRAERSDSLGACEDARNVIADILSALDPQFREDLALVCESHHRNDLDRTDLYDPQKAYGSDLKETVNLQFAAILLRTADLLHVTRDRTPSVTFRLTSPADPKSIEEWSKQVPVVSVRKSPARDANDVVDTATLSDSVRVTATFTEPLGYFALTEYLHWAEKELKQSFSWAEQTRSKEALKYLFPWKRIDTNAVRAVGFESRQFAFELDKPKVLKLLTGHTLYSNPNVVVRELVQNALDAVRLEFESKPGQGCINIRLDTAKRFLTIQDNGTGMTQRIIEDHFLNVGSSRYQDERFLKEHPRFSAISRFGIGILSTFMISDEIEVMTRSSSEKEGRNISIRSLNGKYLIRIVDPTSPDFPDSIREHGTLIRLRVRAGLDLPQVREISRFWILFPGCEVTVQVDDGPVERIGFVSPKAALENALERSGVQTSEAESARDTVFKVVEKRKGGVTLAVALKWSPAFKSWTFARIDSFGAPFRHVNAGIKTGLCVQGIRVENSSPGFQGASIVAISNVTGFDAPSTNVARSQFDAGKEFDCMLKDLYEIYASLITAEIRAMSMDRGLSVAEAASEGRFMLTSLQGNLAAPVDQAAELYAQSLRTVPWLIADEAARRYLVSLSDIEKENEFWTIEGPAYQSAEYFLRRMPGEISIGGLVEMSKAAVTIPEGLLISGYAENFKVHELLLKTFDVDRIDMEPAKKQVSLLWRHNGTTTLWRSLVPRDPDQRQRLNQFVQASFGGRGRPIMLQNEGVTVTGAEGFQGFQSTNRIYLFEGFGLHSYLAKRLDLYETDKLPFDQWLKDIVTAQWLVESNHLDTGETRTKAFANWSSNLVHQGIDTDLEAELRSIMANDAIQLYDPYLGDRYRSGWLYD